MEQVILNSKQIILQAMVKWDLRQLSNNMSGTYFYQLQKINKINTNNAIIII